MMDGTVQTEDLYRACRILFGPEVELSLEFLLYLETSGVKSAYRKRAFETHPDMSHARGEALISDNGDFIDTRWAYEKLSDYIQSRCAHKPRQRHYAAMEPFSRGGVHARKQRKKRRTRKWSSGKQGAAGYYYEGAVPERRLLFGEFLFFSKAISWDALIGAIVWQRRQRPRFGEIGLRWGWLSEGDIKAGFMERRLGERLGQSLIRLGFITREQLDLLIRKQRWMQTPIGEYFVVTGLFSSSDLEGLVQRFMKHNSAYRQEYKGNAA